MILILVIQMWGTVLSAFAFRQVLKVVNAYINDAVDYRDIPWACVSKYTEIFALVCELSKLPHSRISRFQVGFSSTWPAIGL